MNCKIACDEGQLQSAAEILNEMRTVDPNNDAFDLYLATIQMRKIILRNHQSC